MRKAEFYKQVDKTTNEHGDSILSVYKALQYRWEETADPQTDDEKYFFTEVEAKEYLETINLNIGFQAQIEQIEFEYTDFNNAFIFGSEGDIEDFIPNFDNCNAFYCGDVFEGEDITGAIVVQWSYEKHVGYCRNLQDVGIAGEYPFHELKTEKDLITGNEESIFRSNFSVLLTKNEVEDASNIKEAVEEELMKEHWKWNYFRNNPNSYHITERLDELFEKTVTIEEGWICTDLDNEQYGRQISENVYEFKEKNRGLSEYDEEEFIQIVIDLDDYSSDYAENCISAYYSGIDEVKQIYGADFEWIIAECIFEQENGLY